MIVNQPQNLSVLALGKWEEDLERTPPWDAERVSDALNRKKYPQTAVITTTECLSNPMGSPLESLWKFDTWGYNNSSAQEEEERLLSFPGKDIGNEKPWTL